jgi:hypothetical protein
LELVEPQTLLETHHHLALIVLQLVVQQGLTTQQARLAV